MCVGGGGEGARPVRYERSVTFAKAFVRDFTVSLPTLANRNVFVVVSFFVLFLLHTKETKKTLFILVLHQSTVRRSR